MQQARIHSGGGSMPSLQAIDSTPPPPSIDMQVIIILFVVSYCTNISLCSLLLSNEVHRSHKCMDLISGMPTSRGRHKTTYMYYKRLQSGTCTSN